jgi:predicted RNase H-like HicB family nuclease
VGVAIVPFVIDVGAVLPDEGFSVHCPEFPGCWSQGDTIEEARENIIDAVREYLAARRDQEGDTTP